MRRGAARGVDLAPLLEAGDATAADEIADVVEQLVLPR